MSNKNKKPMRPKPSLILLMLCLVTVPLAYLIWYNNMDGQIADLKHSELVKQVELGNVAEVVVDGQQIAGKLKDGGLFESTIISTDKLWWTLQEKGVAMRVRAQEHQSWYFLFMLALTGLGVLFFLFYIRQMQGGMGGGSGKLFNIGKSKARLFMPNNVTVRFKDVAGLNEVKDDLKDVVEFLKKPDKFKRLGAKIPRGVLLTGDPGNGKTLLAKAVAGEASCPFLSISGSDFVEVFVGVGASRVRDLFAQARRHSPCIVFIDEIDAVGRQRGVGMGGGNDEREQTLNQLLAEMDGFTTEAGAVIVLAATNRIDVLDKALLRPGRFDRTLDVPYPDLTSRHHILKVHIKDVIVGPDIDLQQLARGTSGFSGAQLENLINEAALIASKGEKKAVDMHDFEAARDKIIMGAERKSLILSDEERELTAYHESGHALLNVLLPDTDPFHKVTIAPRGHALGVTMSVAGKDVNMRNRNELISRIQVCFGGMLGEKLKTGDFGTGVSNDLEQATSMARGMVQHYGMSDLGPISFSNSIQRRHGEGSHHSEAVMAQIDAEIDKILRGAYASAEKLISQHEDKIHAMSKALMERETLYAEEVYALLGLPAREIMSFIPPVVNAPDEVVAPAKEPVNDGDGENGEG